MDGQLDRWDGHMDMDGWTGGTEMDGHGWMDMEDRQVGWRWMDMDGYGWMDRWTWWTWMDGHVDR